MSDAVVRPATPADAPFLAWVMQEADRMGGLVGSTELIFDFGEARRLDFLARLATSEADSDYQYRRFLVAEVEGQPAAALTGYVPDELPGGAWEQVVRLEAELAGWTASDLDGVLARGERYTSRHYFRVPIPGDTLRVEWVATRPEFRARGLNGLLHEALFERARSAGLRTSHVGTAIGNDPAIAAYRSTGFEVFAEARHVDFEATYGRPGLVFLRRDL